MRELFNAISVLSNYTYIFVYRELFNWMKDLSNWIREIFNSISALSNYTYI